MSQSPVNSSASTGLDSGEQDKIIDSLIATYRELNLKVRPVPESQLTGRSTGSESVKSLLQHLRDQELTFAQSLKVQLSGVAPEEVGGESAPVIGLETEENSVPMLISQFGTARATTLSLLKGLAPDAWNQSFRDGKSLLDHIREIISRDRSILDQISSAMKAN